jgi:DUF4097 and DUF4098 domain-containing protein YvlB
MKTMPSFPSLLTAIATGCLLSAGATSLSGASGQFRSEFHQTYPLTEKGRVSLENVNGAIHITVWDRNEVKVDAVKTASSQARLDEVEIKVDAGEKSVRIKTKYPENSKNNQANVDYTLAIPRAALLDKVVTVNGAVEIKGPVEVGQISTVNGRLLVNQVAGKANLSTVNGNIEAHYLQDTDNGGISLSVVNGSITLYLPVQANAELSAHTVNGRIHCDFDVPVDKQFPVGQNLNAKLGKGGPAYKLNSVNGNIAINKSAKLE